MSFYIYKNNEQTGPFEESFVENKLRSGSFLPNDLARHEDMSEWAPLSTFFPLETVSQSAARPTRHATPKCLSCGTITDWEIEPILLARHWVVFLILLCGMGAGLLYLPIVYIIRMNSNSRSKICPSCGARNMWTFQY